VRSRGGGGTSRFVGGSIGGTVFAAAGLVPPRAIGFFVSGVFPRRAMGSHYGDAPPSRHDTTFPI
jgi:hypothetical protein